MFGFVVSVYLLNVIGIPVYFHYCGGELETINYVVKGKGCCGDEGLGDDGCCKDEQLVLLNANDFILKSHSSLQFIKSIDQVSFVQIATPKLSQGNSINNQLLLLGSVPIRLQKQEVLSTFILRI